MSTSIRYTLIAMLLTVSYLFPESSFVDFRQNEISVKVTQEALTSIDKDMFSAGLTGITEIDRLRDDYPVQSVKFHFPSIHNSSLDQWLQIRFSDAVDVTTVADAYNTLSSILVAEAIPIHKIYQTPNDPSFSSQWHISQTNDADIDAPEAWDIQTGNPEIIVAVMDTGVRWWHKDLAGALADNTDRNSIRGNIWINTNELSDTDSGVDEDGNGYNDDWVGWDFVTGNPQSYSWDGEDYDVEDNDPRDFNGHGTHCAGNVGAINNNGEGGGSAAGGWGEDANGYGNGVKIMSLRIGWNDRFIILESGYVDMGFAANAFVYARDNGARIASCSWGSSETTVLREAVNYFIYGHTENPTSGEDVQGLIFKAAGNDDDEASDYLSDRTDVIAVAATDENDTKASFSTYGTWVDISAPGNNIFSTHHDHNNPDVDDYETMSGTSMATPITAGVTALIWSFDPQLKAPDIQMALFNGSDNIESKLNAQYQSKMGIGRVNAKTSLDIISSPSAIDLDGGKTIDVYNLAQNYPNPFNPSTKINYELTITNYVKLEVFNSAGQKVRTLVNEIQEAGNHAVRFNANGLASGVYLYRLSTGNGLVSTKKMILMR